MSKDVFVGEIEFPVTWKLFEISRVFEIEKENEQKGKVLGVNQGTDWKVEKLKRKLKSSGKLLTPEKSLEIQETFVCLKNSANVRSVNVAIIK